VRYIGGKSDFYLNLAKAMLVQFVRNHTEGYHDVAIAKLLSVMLGTGYGEVDHRVWRGKYEKRLKQYRPNPTDTPALRAKKTLLECYAARLYRMDILHPGKQHLRRMRRTVLRPD